MAILEYGSHPTALALAFGSALYIAYVVVDRMVLSPLAKFPGPKIAGLTGLYEAYFQCIKEGGGRYYIEIERMHDKYGMVC